MENITIAPQVRQDLIIEMKREAQPQAEDTHRAARLRRTLAHRDRSRALLLLSTTVYAVVSRFVGEGRAAFDDRRPHGPRPLLGQEANERVEKLLEEDSPIEHGWLRSPASLELQAARCAASQGKGKARLREPGDRAPRAAPPGLPLEEAAPRPARERLRRADHREARQARGCPANDGAGGGLFFPGRIPKLETNPKVGFCWMRRGKQKPLRTPGTNRKVWISGALNFKTGRLHWVSGERRNDELFIKLLDKLRRTYRCHKELHLATDNDSSHLSKRVKEYVQESAGRIRLHPLPSWSPESNPVELVWWSLHEAVSRNHECAGLDDLVEFAEGYLEERQPFGPKLGEVYDRRERPPPRGRASVHLSRGVI
jgi:putative transposase